MQVISEGAAITGPVARMAEASAVIVGAATAAELSAVLAAAASPPPDLDWDDMALDDPQALDNRRWAVA